MNSNRVGQRVPFENKSLEFCYQNKWKLTIGGVCISVIIGTLIASPAMFALVSGKLPALLVLKGTVAYGMVAIGSGMIALPFVALGVYGIVRGVIYMRTPYPLPPAWDRYSSSFNPCTRVILPKNPIENLRESNLEEYSPQEIVQIFEKIAPLSFCSTHLFVFKASESFVVHKSLIAHQKKSIHITKGEYLIFSVWREGGLEITQGSTLDHLKQPQFSSHIVVTDIDTLKRFIGTEKQEEPQEDPQPQPQITPPAVVSSATPAIIPEPATPISAPIVKVHVKDMGESKVLSAPPIEDASLVFLRENLKKIDQPKSVSELRNLTREEEDFLDEGEMRSACLMWSGGRPHKSGNRVIRNHHTVLTDFPDKIPGILFKSHQLVAQRGRDEHLKALEKWVTRSDVARAFCTDRELHFLHVPSSKVIPFGENSSIIMEEKVKFISKGHAQEALFQWACYDEELSDTMFGMVSQLITFACHFHIGISIDLTEEGYISLSDFDYGLVDDEWDKEATLEEKMYTIFSQIPCGWFGQLEGLVKIETRDLPPKEISKVLSKISSLKQEAIKREIEIINLRPFFTSKGILPRSPIVAEATTPLLRCINKRIGKSDYVTLIIGRKIEFSHAYVKTPDWHEPKEKIKIIIEELQQLQKQGLIYSYTVGMEGRFYNRTPTGKFTVIC